MSEPAGFAYDVFISYSHDDRAWVWEELLPRLESVGLRVCIDDRDFEIGVPLLSNIERAVPEALDHGSFFFADIERNQVDAAGLALLRLLATRGEGTAIPRHALAREFPDEDELERTLGLLIRRELIEPIADGYRFQVELIRRWFARD